MQFGLEVVTPPTEFPLSLSEALLHLRLDEAYAGASLVQTYLEAAQGWVEEAISRRFGPQTWRLSLDRWPSGRTITLPFPPLIQVQSVRYYDTAGVDQLLAASLYTVDVAGFAGRVVLIDGALWPNLQRRPAAVRVEFQCGYSAGRVPGALKSAMLLLLGHLYENREQSISGTIINDIPMGVEALIGPYRAALV